MGTIIVNLQHSVLIKRICLVLFMKPPDFLFLTRRFSCLSTLWVYDHSEPGGSYGNLVQSRGFFRRNHKISQIFTRFLFLYKSRGFLMLNRKLEFDS